MMFIQNDHIALRCAEPEDASRIFHWENSRDIWRVSGTHVPFTLFQIEQFLLSNNDLFSQKQLRLMICRGDQTIGCIDIYDYDPINQRAAIGILIEASNRGQGFAKESLSLLIDYLFNDLLLHQVHCSIDETNTASQQLFLQQGFTPCGRRKQWIKTPDGFIDELEFQLMRP